MEDGAHLGGDVLCRIDELRDFVAHGLGRHLGSSGLEVDITVVVVEAIGTRGKGGHGAEEGEDGRRSR